MNEPGKGEWAGLYQAAIAFKQAAPWQWMANEDLFAVENPYNGEVGYCSVLGIGGEEFGLGIFLGDKGLQYYARLMSEDTEPEELDEKIMVPLLTMLFMDREELHKEDREVVRSLGLSFRGRNAWPLFRSQKPGYVPWLVEKDEVLFLTIAIQQALVVAGQVFKYELRLLKYGTSDSVYTRCFRGGSWRGEWRKLKIPNQAATIVAEPVGPLNEATLQLLCRRSRERSGCWELDIFVLPVPVRDASGRPYFPLGTLAVTHDLGIIVDSNLAQPWLTLAERQNRVIQILEKTDQLPQEIWVKSRRIKEIMKPIVDALGIRLRVRSLRLLEEAKASLLSLKYLDRAAWTAFLN